MKYHVNGAKIGGDNMTLIHVESGDDQLAFLINLLQRAFSFAQPVGGPIMWSRHISQEPMLDSEARRLIEEMDCGSYIAYSIKALVYRQRKLGIELLEFNCTCKADEPVFVLNEKLFHLAHGQSSENFLQQLGARPWTKHIRGLAIMEQQRGKENLN